VVSGDSAPRVLLAQDEQLEVVGGVTAGAPHEQLHGAAHGKVREFEIAPRTASDGVRSGRRLPSRGLARTSRPRPRPSLRTLQAKHTSAAHSRTARGTRCRGGPGPATAPSRCHLVDLEKGCPSGRPPVALGGRPPGLELGHQGAGVAGAQAGRGRQLGATDRRARGAEVGVGALGLRPLGQRLGATAALAGACSALASATTAPGRRWCRRGTADSARRRSRAATPGSRRQSHTRPRLGGATAIWSRVDRATEATSSSHDSRSTARCPRRLASSTLTSMARARASVPRGHSSGDGPATGPGRR